MHHVDIKQSDPNKKPNIDEQNRDITIPNLTSIRPIYSDPYRWYQERWIHITLVVVFISAIATVFLWPYLFPEKTIAKHISRGKDYLKQENYGKARILFLKIIKINPKHAEGHYQLGLVWEKEKRLGLAIKEFSAAVESDPKHLPGLTRSGRYAF